MRAAVLTKQPSRLEVFDLSATEVGPREVLVETRASGLCHSDLAQMNGDFGEASLPMIMGHEGAGYVVEVGKEVETLRKGDHVIASWVPACGRCHSCVRGRANLCENSWKFRPPWKMPDGRDVHAMGGLGTMAELMLASELAFIKVESDLPDEYLALIGCGVTTGALAAMRAAPVTPGSSVAVFGCGGVGSSVVQGARIAGAVPLIVVDPVVRKREAALKLGATHVIDPSAVDAVEAIKELTGGRGADFAFDAVGRDDTATWAVRAVRLGGTAVCVGLGGHPDISSINAAMPKTVKWTLYGDADPRRDFQMLADLVSAGLLDMDSIVNRRLKMEEVNEGFDAMEQGDIIRSVILL